MKNWPRYFSDLLYLGNPRSSIAVATLWTEKSIILEKLGSDAEKLSVVGQLYLKQSINLLLRNVFLNPVLKEIIICGADQTGSGKALMALVSNGIDDNRNIIGVDNAHIDSEIDRNAIELFRKNVKTTDARCMDGSDILAWTAGEVQEAEAWMEPTDFPEAKIYSPETLPSERAAFRIEAEKVGDCWLRILDTIMRFGHVKKSQHSSDQREIIDLVAVITGEDLDNIDWKDFFMFTREELVNYIPQVITANPVNGINYTYGQRLGQQVQWMIDDLKANHFSRRAVASLWDVKNDHNNPHAPCLDLIQGLVQNNELFFTAFIRSNDMFEAWPMNTLAFMHLQRIIAEACGFKIGTFVMMSGSAHIYSDGWNQAQDILNNHGHKLCCRLDPRGNFYIRIEGDKIVATQMNTSGQTIAFFIGSTAKEIIDQLLVSQAVSDIGHAFDLGSELRKAEIALKKGILYVQDRKLDL